MFKKNGQKRGESPAPAEKYEVGDRKEFVRIPIEELTTTGRTKN